MLLKLMVNGLCRSVKCCHQCSMKVPMPFLFGFPTALQTAASAKVHHL